MSKKYTEQEVIELQRKAFVEGTQFGLAPVTYASQVAKEKYHLVIPNEICVDEYTVVGNPKNPAKPKLLLGGKEVEWKPQFDYLNIPYLNRLDTIANLYEAVSKVVRNPTKKV